MSLPGTGGGSGTAAGVRLNRGAGAGWRTPPTSMNVPRATLCGCPGASAMLSTGVTQASDPSNTSAHSAWVLAANAAVSRSRSAGQPDGSSCGGRSETSSPSRPTSSA